MSLKLYGVPFSQPFRAVAWSLLLKGKKFQVQLVNPGGKGKNGTKTQKFLELNPGGTIPLLEDDGFVLAESNAIVTYLANKYQWTDLYPSDPKRRALVDWYLHYHHQSIRPMVGVDLVKAVRPDIVQPDIIREKNAKVFRNALKSLNNGWLSNRDYLTGSEYTLADIVAYSEIGRLPFLFPIICCRNIVLKTNLYNCLNFLRSCQRAIWYKVCQFIRF